jgi:prepilin-type N-terminal cleavage/methylation domain-containing protein
MKYLATRFLRGVRALPKSQRGDTIIEVLIATAIVSLVLTSAYALTSRNVRTNQAVQEQAYAQKLVEKQVELLRAVASKPTSDKCFNDSGTPVDVTDAACKPTNGGADYQLTVHPTGSADTYSITATWASLTGGNSNITVYYRVAP